MVGYQLENTLTENGHVARGVCTMNEAGELVSVVGKNTHRAKKETERRTQKMKERHGQNFQKEALFL